MMTVVLFYAIISNMTINSMDQHESKYRPSNKNYFKKYVYLPNIFFLECQQFRTIYNGVPQKFLVLKCPTTFF